MMMVTELKDYGQGVKGMIKYLTESISDQAALMPDSISGSTRYYASEGTPPGIWLGSGVKAFKGIKPGSVVTASQLENLIGRGCDPDTGEQLGTAFRKITPARIDENFVTELESLRETAPGLAKRLLNEYLRVNAKPVGSVHGFDYTFAPMKDVSILWGLGDQGVREIIEKAHHDAIDKTMQRFEDIALYTRTGTGGKVRAKTRGVVATRYDHWDSREGDPHLHSHVVVANRVQTSEGKWLTIDSRGSVFPSAVALSEYYDNMLMDLLSARLGVVWSVRSTTRSGKNVWGIQGINNNLIEMFSTRHRRILSSRDFEGNREDDRDAWGKTRPAKRRRSLEALRNSWEERAHALGESVAQSVDLDRAGRGLSSPQDFSDEDKIVIAQNVMAELETSRAVWSRWNVLAEAERATRDIRLAWGRNELVEEITDKVLARAVELNPGGKGQPLWSSQKILDAEAFMLEMSQTYTSKALDRRGAAASLTAWRHMEGWGLSHTQTGAAWEIATSAKTCEILVGPAGAGKTATLSALVDTWRENGGNVYGYAPSAAAARVLKESTGAANTLASWIHSENRPVFDANTLIIIDEAAMCSTLELAEITHAVKQSGAKILLVGDPYQLNSVEAGGVFAMLERNQPGAPSLSEVRRFKNEWEATASLALRAGKDLSVAATYLKHGRIREGNQNEIEQAMFNQWWEDTQAGKESLMLAVDNETVSRLNQAAQARLAQAGKILNDGPGLNLRDGNTVRIGDKIVTRRNARNIHEEIINGAGFQVKTVNPDGTLLVSPLGKNTLFTLPAQYVSQHIDLGYAGTIHRAQGRTVDTCHTMINEHTTANSLYVGMTRGKENNTAWAVCSKPRDPDGPEEQPLSGLQIFTQAILNRENNNTALETLHQHQPDHATSNEGNTKPAPPVPAPTPLSLSL